MNSHSMGIAGSWTSGRSAQTSKLAGCYPGTREAILARLQTQCETSTKPSFIWFTGPAGVGKSAIARTLCDRLHTDTSLLASFFFNRQESEGQDAKSFVPSLAFQLCRSFPGMRSSVDHLLRAQPSLSQSMERQAKSLIFDPLSGLPRDRTWSTHRPLTIVIDGLDECNPLPQQSSVLQTLNALVPLLPPSITIVVTSRPEVHIRSEFNTDPFRDKTRIETLDDATDDDIRHFYHGKLTSVISNHPRTRQSQAHISLFKSPTFGQLVEKTSGSFQLADALAQCVQSPHLDPQKRLEHIIKHLPPNTSKPANSLDKLYASVLCGVPERDLSVLLSILGVLLVKYTSVSHPNPYMRGVLDLRFAERVLGLNHDHSLHILRSIDPLIHLHNHSEIRIPHSSFRDFLLDKDRSQCFYISEHETYARVLKALIRLDLCINDEALRGFARINFQLLLTSSDSSKELVKAIKDIDFTTMQSRATESALITSAHGADTWINVCNAFLQAIMCSACIDIAAAFPELFDSFRRVVEQRVLKVYLPDAGLWAVLYGSLPLGSGHIEFGHGIPQDLIAVERSGGFHLLGNVSRSGRLAFLSRPRTLEGPLSQNVAEMLSGGQVSLDSGDAWRSEVIRQALTRFSSLGSDLPTFLAQSGLLRLGLPASTTSEDLAQALYKLVSTFSNKIDRGDLEAIQDYLQREALKACKGLNPQVVIDALRIMPNENPDHQPQQAGSPILTIFRFFLRYW